MGKMGFDEMSFKGLSGAKVGVAIGSHARTLADIGMGREPTPEEVAERKLREQAYQYRIDLVEAVDLLHKLSASQFQYSTSSVRNRVARLLLDIIRENDDALQALETPEAKQP